MKIKNNLKMKGVFIFANSISCGYCNMFKNDKNEGWPAIESVLKNNENIKLIEILLEYKGGIFILPKEYSYLEKYVQWVPNFLFIPKNKPNQIQVFGGVWNKDKNLYEPPKNFNITKEHILNWVNEQLSNVKILKFTSKCKYPKKTLHYVKKNQFTDIIITDNGIPIAKLKKN